MMTFKEYVESRSAVNEGRFGRLVGNVLGGTAGLLGGAIGGAGLGALAGSAVVPGAGTAVGGFGGAWAGGAAGMISGAKTMGDWGDKIGDRFSYAFANRTNKVIKSSSKVQDYLDNLRNDLLRAKQENPKFLPNFDAVMAAIDRWKTDLANLNRHINNKYNNAQNPLTAITRKQAAAMPAPPKKSPPPGLKPTHIPRPPKI